MLVNIFRSPSSFFDTTPQGRITNRFSKDVDMVDTVIPMTLQGFLMTVISTISTMFILAYSTPLILAIILPVAIVYFFIQV